MNAYILAGGDSARMNRDKAYLYFKGKYFIDTIIECTSQLFNKVYVVGRDYQHPLLEDSLKDEIQDIGPLGGIYTALSNTDKVYNFITGIDYPLMTPHIIHHLASFPDGVTQKYAGLIPVTPDGPHPLFAFYSKSCLSSIEKCIEKQRYQIRCISHYQNIIYLNLIEKMTEEEFHRIEKSFTNINSEYDYKKINKFK